MRFSYKGWETVVKILQLAVGLSICSIVFNHGLVQTVHYNWFKINRANYNVIEADIIDRKIYKLIPRREMAVAELVCVKISYVIDDDNFVKWVYSYPDMVEQDKIRIGVHDTNPKKVLRCEPYVISFNERKMYYILFIILLLLIVVDKLSYKMQIYVKKYKEIENVQKEEFSKEELEKQDNILLHIKECPYLEQDLQKRIIHFKDKGVLFNKGTLWILSKYVNNKQMMEILNMLPFMDDEKYLSFLENMYEQGFPEKYYILAKNNENYYCCRQESERLYMYSRGIGITNTQYETIYDYIIEQIEKDYPV